MGFEQPKSLSGSTKRAGFEGRSGGPICFLNWWYIFWPQKSVRKLKFCSMKLTAIFVGEKNPSDLVVLAKRTHNHFKSIRISFTVFFLPKFWSRKCVSSKPPIFVSIPQRMIFSYLGPCFFLWFTVLRYNDGKFLPVFTRRFRFPTYKIYKIWDKESPGLSRCHRHIVPLHHPVAYQS